MEENIIDNIAEFYNILWTTGDFYNKIFNLENCVLEFSGDFIVGGGTNITENSNYSILTIRNCTFNCKKIEFNDLIKKDLHIYFEDCTFNCALNFKNSQFKELWFSDTKAFESLNFEMDESKEDKIVSNLIRIVNNENSSKIKSQFVFNNVEIKNALIIENIDIEEITIFNSFINDFSIYNSILSYLYFYENSFSGNTCFNKIILQKNDSSIEEKYKKGSFSKNKFENATFLETEFTEKRTFHNCEFQNITRFEKCKNIQNSVLKFTDCDFKNFTSFKHSEFNSLDIDNCIFEKSASFIETVFNKIILSEVNFLGKTYFDDIKINDVANESYLKNDVTEWKRTIRTIKQELQKTDNKIDYGRFRVYEFNAYRKELTNKKPTDKILSRTNREKNRLSRDLFILRWSNTVSEYGTNWKRAFLFTLLFGFLSYFTITFIESQLIGSKLSFAPTDINSFVNGMFNFFIVTDFKSMLDLKVVFEDKYFLYSIMAFLYRITFVVCKIIIAFGLYETVQSFRKFKA
jgi:hypothetical protein